MKAELDDIINVLQPYMARAKIIDRYPASERKSRFDAELNNAATEILDITKSKDTKQVLEEAFGETIHTDLKMYMERVLAGMFGRQPEISGDQRKRLTGKELRAVENIAAAILDALDKK